MPPPPPFQSPTAALPPSSNLSFSSVQQPAAVQPASIAGMQAPASFPAARIDAIPRPATAANIDAMRGEEAVQASLSQPETAESGTAAAAAVPDTAIESASHVGSMTTTRAERADEPVFTSLRGGADSFGEDTESAAALPPPQARPQKERKARPLSMAFERLRSRSRGASLRDVETPIIEAPPEKEVAKEVQEEAVGKSEKREKRRLWGGRARPQSLIFGGRPKTREGGKLSAARGGEGVPTMPSTGHGVGAAIPEGSTDAARASTPPLPSAIQRTEAWEADDALLPPKTPEGRELRAEGVGRLGVLPSPAPTALTFDAAVRDGEASLIKGRDRKATLDSQMVREEGPESVETEEREGDPMPVVEESAAAVPTPAFDHPAFDTRAEEKMRAEDVGIGESAAPQQFYTGAIDAEQPDLQRPDASDATPLQEPSDLENTRQPAAPLTVQIRPTEPPPRPHTARKVSALASLPSQKRWTQSDQNSPVVPTFPFHKRDVSSEDDEYFEARAAATDKGKSTTTLPRADKDDELYESTPVAGRRNWLAGPHDDTIAGAEPDGSRPTTAQDFDDARSDISAEDSGVMNTSSMVRPLSTIDLVSRHSSVSSIAKEDTPMADVHHMREGEDQTTVPSQAALAEPIMPSAEDSPLASTPVAAQQSEPQFPQQDPMNSQEDLVTKQRFAERAYRQARPADRPLSYMALGQAAPGAPAQDISESTSGQATPVDLSGFSGPPVGTPPFQQHPVFRNSASVQPTEYEQLQGSVSETASQARQTSAADTAPEPKPKRFSGFFRGAREPAVPNEPIPSAPFGSMPPPKDISDHHGLEDLNMTRSMSPEVEAPAPLPSQPAVEEKQRKRRSGIWETLASRRLSTAGKAVQSRESFALPADSQLSLGGLAAASSPVVGRDESMGVAPAPTRNTLKKQPQAPPPAKEPQKPQRSATTSVSPDQKKKRFSGIGSLFGRSGTMGHGTPKPNRLTKTQPPAKEDVSRSDSSAPQSASANTVTGSVRGYEAYEAIRRRELAGFQDSSNRYPTPNVPPQSYERPMSSSYVPPVEGYYSPNNSSPASPIESAMPSFPRQRGPPPAFRRMHSGGAAPQGVFENIPEAFRPTSAAYNRPVEPIGPPEEHLPPVRDVAGSQDYPTRQPSYPAPPPPGSLAHGQGLRQTSYGSDVSAPDYARPGGRYGALSQISPVQTRSSSGGYTPGAGRRMGSIGQEMAHSPAREHGDQQTPWSIGVPRIASGNTLGGLPEGRPMGARPASAVYGQQYSSQQPLYRSQTSGGGAYPPMPRQAPPRPASAYAYPDQSGYDDYDTGPPLPMMSRGPYDAALPIRDPPPNAQQQQAYPPPQNRYYGPSKPPDYPGPASRPATVNRQSSNGPLTYHRRTPSGFSGRRDDPAMGEEALLVMQGASYPGQEWAPEGQGRR